MVPSLLALSDVMGTGWFAADAANVKPGKTVAVVGDGAVGLLGVLSAKQMGAERIIAMSRHESRQKLDRKSTRLNSSHGYISYAVFCLKKKKKNTKSSLTHKQ